MYEHGLVEGKSLFRWHNDAPFQQVKRLPE